MAFSPPHLRLQVVPLPLYTAVLVPVQILFRGFLALCSKIEFVASRAYSCTAVLEVEYRTHGTIGHEQIRGADCCSQIDGGPRGLVTPPFIAELCTIKKELVCVL